jgi:predicted transcriptional regulator
MSTPTLGQRLACMRRKAGLTIPELHRSSGVSTGTISDAENDKKDMRVSTLIKILDATKQRKSFRL